MRGVVVGDSATCAAKSVGDVVVIAAAGPAVAVAVTTIGGIPSTLIVSVSTPTRGPSVHVPTLVGPRFVFPGTSAIDPFAAETVTVNRAFDTAAPFASSTMNCGGVCSFCPAAPDCPSPETTRTEAGGPDGDVESLHETRKSASAPIDASARMLGANTWILERERW